jgi:hypothetical protein
LNNNIVITVVEIEEESTLKNQPVINIIRSLPGQPVILKQI